MGKPELESKKKPYYYCVLRVSSSVGTPVRVVEDSVFFTVDEAIKRLRIEFADILTGSEELTHANISGDGMFARVVYKHWNGLEKQFFVTKCTPMNITE